MGFKLLITLYFDTSWTRLGFIPLLINSYLELVFSKAKVLCGEICLGWRHYASPDWFQLYLKELNPLIPQKGDTLRYCDLFTILFQAVIFPHCGYAVGRAEVWVA